MAQRPLIGTSPNQVSTNGMLGDLAFQDSNGAYIETIRGAVNLDKLDKEITDTAVDIFVYDTRKDSDGGAWRKRTQHTSWYNETLNTATRGSRKDFPAVAVIVSELSKVTIYDGDDPDLPMWMVFNVGGTVWTSNNLLAQSGASTTWSLSAVNGTICFAPAPIAYRLRVVNFISEYVYVTSDAGGKVYNGSIAERNSEKGYNDNSSIGTTVQGVFNDVAMTVLPNAPIDDATGLPIPTIAVATDGGVSVIKDDGNVATITGFAPTQKVEIDEKYVISTARTISNDFIFKAPIPSVTSAYNAGFTPTYGGGFYAESRSNQTIPKLRNDDTSALVYTSDEVICMGGTAGVELIGKEINVSNTVSQSPIAYISSSYNTGWMYGDIKGAFLSDTDATNVTGTELVTNGTFDTDTTGWTAYNSVISVDSNRLRVDDTASAGGWSSAVQEISTEIGKQYILQFTFTSSADTALVGHYAGSYASAGAGTVPTSYTDYGTTSGTYTRYITATTTTTSIVFAVNNQGVSFFDNISLKLAEEDRSVNNKGLQVFGTITKTPVATGAELVGYSGFSGSNVLVQPYNSSLDFGTGDFYMMSWYRISSFSDHETIISREDREFDISILTNGEIRIYARYDSSTVNSTTTSSSVHSTGVWNHVAAVFTDGNTCRIYVNGNLVAGPSTHNYNITGSNSQELFIGVRKESGSFIHPSERTEIALTRVGGSSPSAEQIKKIYEDEKVLFQENAACTLYGSSDAVTALAYDDSTNLLYAGTSSGRSDFQGLRRINNTTTAVTTAISASNGLVAEQ